MIVLGLTGSIGMGKSTAANMFRALGVPVHDADATVHDLLADNRQVRAAIDARFPGVVMERAVDRQALGAAVFGNPEARRDLESILHPRVRRASEIFLRRHRVLGTALVVLDIPLLYETGGEARVDGVVVVSAPAAMQRRRVMARPGMDEDRFSGILASQMPDHEKRRRADFVVETGLGKAYTFAKLKRIVLAIRAVQSGSRGTHRSTDPIRSEPHHA
ncbi:MAG: dephospho-CoA kinase [Alphaproteobacteria bacterium]|jgi:dephospho-CoA kinase|nr:dephospho-CoA kinase [Alphaproteobacteria bacterium]